MKDKKDASPSLIIRMIKDTSSIAKWLVLCSLISMVSVALSLTGPKILGTITDAIYDYWSGTASLSMDYVTRACLVLAVIYILSSLCELFTMYIMNNMVSKYYTCGLRIRISDKIKRLPIKFVDSTPKGEVISRMMDDVSTMGNTIHTFLGTLINGFLKLIGITIIIFMISPAMASAVIVFVPLSLLLSAWIATRSQKHFQAARKSNGDIYSLSEEDFTGFETVKAFNLEDRQRLSHEKLCETYREKLKEGYFLSGIVQPIVTLANNMAYIVICIVGGGLAVNCKVQVGDIVALVLYAKQFAGPLESIANGLSNMQNTLAAAKRVYGLLDEKEMETEKFLPIPDIKGEVIFENVSFSYSPYEPLITDLNMHIRSGQKVAIVGPTGGGKTTIVNLLMRFYDVQKGRILIDGTDIASISRADLRSMFSMVLQDTWLFSGTIYDNIAYGKENATKEEVMEAAKHAHIDHFIHTLPEGYNTMINEESGNISSGQKQLLTIARAYLANRRMLILDEATSNVDTRTEILIQNTMDGLMKNRTSFVIAHRLSTIVDADIILVVKNGSIVEQGSHKELLKRNGFYTEIYNSQYELLQ